jgi:hypothetical protein
MPIKELTIRIHYEDGVPVPSSQEVFRFLFSSHQAKTMIETNKGAIMKLIRSIGNKDKQIFQINVSQLPDELEWDGPWE